MSPQKKWGTRFTLFTKYGPIPRLLLQHLRTPGEYDTRISACDLLLKSKIQEPLETTILFPAGGTYGIGGSHSVFLMRPLTLPEFKCVSAILVRDIDTLWYIGYDRIGKSRSWPTGGGGGGGGRAQSL